MKIIGLLCAFGAEDLIEPAMKQALEICDETIVNVSCHSENLMRFEDDTFNKAKEFCNKHNNIKLLDESPTNKNHSEAKAEMLNKMLHESRYYDVGDWIFVLDVDEFYFPYHISILKNSLRNNDEVNQIWFKARYFYIDSKHYLISEHDRLFKIQEVNFDMDKRFFPTQKWYAEKYKIGVVPIEYGMFHYGTATNPHMKLEFWKTEYAYKAQSNKVEWIDKIYRNYDLKHQELWNKENERLFGIYSPWFQDNFIADPCGNLFVYEGDHPVVVQDTFITQSKDYRLKYHF